MSTRRFFLFAFVSAFTGCSGSTESVVAGQQDAPPGQTSTPPSDVGVAPFPEPVVELPAGAEERRIMLAVVPEQLAELRRLVGRYARGEASIFEGVLTARDNMGSLGATYEDGVMNAASVNASLGWEEEIYWNGQHVAGWALQARSATHRIRIAQSSAAPQGTTSLSLVLPNDVSGGMTGTCAGCVSPFDRLASVITIDDVVATGKWGNDRPLEVRANGRLTRIPLADVTFERIVAVADPTRDAKTMAAFRHVGNEMVRTADGNHREPAPVPAGETFHACERTTRYELDWFVDRSQISRQGLRNMRITGTQTCCSEGPHGGCAPQTCF